MNRLAAGALLAALAILCFSNSAMAQSKPEFKLGFKSIADQIPTIVGEPLENEQYSANGDSTQRTTTGLMVWRKYDRWTAFTNGYMTWVLGPYGLQSRLNTELYPWESVPPGPTPIAQQPSTSAPPLEPIVAVPTATPIPAAAPIPAAPTPTPTSSQTYSPDVTAYDSDSAGAGVMVKGFVSEIDNEWARVWGWRPHRPTTVYLCYDGERLASAMNDFLGSNLSWAEMESVASTNVAARGRDVKTGGWAIIMHVNYRWGMEDWEATTKATFLHEYAYIMLWEMAGDAGPLWFREGFAQWVTYSKVFGTASEQSVVDYTADAYDSGTLPSLHALTNSWGETIGSNSVNLETAYGVSYLAVKYLTQKVGGMPIIQVLQRTAAGENFETALAALTGYNLNTLNGDYRVLIPDD